MATLVRAASVRGIDDLVDELGGDGAALLDRFGLGAATLDSDHALIALPTAVSLLETAAAELDCPDLGLRLAERQRVGILGPLAVAITNSATLGDAFDSAVRYLFVHSPSLDISTVPDPEGRRGVRALRFGGTRTAIPPQSLDLRLGLVHRIIGTLVGRYGLRSVYLPHPPLAPVDRYTGFFGADVRFDQREALLRVPAGLRRLPLDGGDRVLRELALSYLESHYPDPRRPVAERVRAALAEHPDTVPPRITAVADRLRLHPRTLQRHLAAESTTFDAILDDHRRSTAYRLITGTDLPFGRIAAMVGLAEQSGLTRAVRRWFGVPPRRLRAEARGRNRL